MKNTTKKPVYEYGIVGNSWIIRNKSTKKVICEIFNPKLVDKLNAEKYEAMPVLDYLVELNSNLKRKEWLANSCMTMAQALARYEREYKEMKRNKKPLFTFSGWLRHIGASLRD